MYLAVLSIGAASGAAVYTDQHHTLPQVMYGLESVEFRPSGFSRCRYMGVSLPYERTWTEQTEEYGTPVVRNPQPGIAGHVTIIYSKNCKGERTQDARFYVESSHGPFIPKDSMRMAFDFKPGTPTVWYEQIKQRLLILGTSDYRAIEAYSALERGLAGVKAGGEPVEPQLFQLNVSNDLNLAHTFAQPIYTVAWQQFATK